MFGLKLTLKYIFVCMTYELHIKQILFHLYVSRSTVTLNANFFVSRNLKEKCLAGVRSCYLQMKINK